MPDLTERVLLECNNCGHTMLGDWSDVLTACPACERSDVPEMPDEEFDLERAKKHNLLALVLVRQLHDKRESHDGYGMVYRYCAECRQSWPCKTEQVIADALAVPDAVPPARVYPPGT